MSCEDVEKLREWANWVTADANPEKRDLLRRAADAMEERDLLRKQEDSNFQKFYEVREALRELVEAGDIFFDAFAEHFGSPEQGGFAKALRRAKGVLGDG